MEKRTMGTVISVKKQWWIKVNTKPFRKHALDGAVFPHIVKARYVVNGTEIIKRKWLGASVTPPCVNEKVTVIYQEDKPTKCKLGLYR